MNRLQNPLSEDEYDQLGALLDQRHSAMNLEMLDGFFAALICGPELVPPSEYLPRIWGEDPAPWRDERELRAFFDLSTRHWNSVARTLNSNDIYLPLLLEDGSGNAPANDWAVGFTNGMKMRGDAWAHLFDDTDEAGIIVPILTLAHEHDPDPEMRPFKEPPSAQQRQQLLVSAAASVPMIYKYFARGRRSAAQIMREAASARRLKIGRNDPCLCGSGKKYKKCCGAPSLH